MKKLAGLIGALLFLGATVSEARPFIIEYYLSGKSSQDLQTVTIEAKTESYAKGSFKKMFPNATLVSIKEK